jgi:hypothetical protein
VCCGAAKRFGNTSSSCATACTATEEQLCSTVSDCPAGDRCVAVPFSAIEKVCQAGRMPRDAGGGG